MNIRNKNIEMKPEHQNAKDTISAGVLGMRLFLVSLGVLFVTSLVGYIVIRSRADQWPPPGMPTMPIGFWVSTAIIILSTVTIRLALKACRAGQSEKLKRWLNASYFLGLSFLALQWWNWTLLYKANMTADGSLYGYTFYMLTGLHALHVIGGLFPMGWLAFRAYRKDPCSELRTGLLYCRMYWDFLGGVWLVLFIVLFEASWSS